MLPTVVSSSHVSHCKDIHLLISLGGWVFNKRLTTGYVKIPASYETMPIITIFSLFRKGNRLFLQSSLGGCHDQVCGFWG